MEYRQLRSFVAVAKAQSFSGATNEVHLSQSALSYQIRCLEDHLQMRLFERHARGAQLTDGGKALLPLAARLINDTERARTMLRKKAGALEGPLSFGITPTPARLFVPELLVASATETSLRIEVKHGFSGGHYEELIQGSLDLALCYAVTDLPALRGMKLYHDDVFLVGPPDMVATAKGDLSFEQLGEFPLVLSDTAHLARRRVEKLARERSIRLNVVHEVDMTDVQRQLVIGHRRCTLASWGLFLDELGSGRLGGRRIVDPPLTRTMHLFARPGLEEAVLEYVGAKLRESVSRKVSEQRSDYWWLSLPA